MGSLAKQFDHSATTSHMLAMRRADAIEARVAFILQDAGTETGIFECASCGASFTRTLRSQGNSAPTKRGGLD
jgi:hypothetical protein